MKIILQSFLIFLFSQQTFSQTTAIPDLNFETALINLGIDSGTPDGQVLTANIVVVTSLDVSSNEIGSLQGIEGFISLLSLNCSDNQLTSLDVTQQTGLLTLWCQGNELTNLDISQNTLLSDFQCSSNQLVNIDFSQNTALSILWCANNEMTSLDLSNNPNITQVLCASNELYCLDLRNGNNTIIVNLNSLNNPTLACIGVDDEVYSVMNWTDIDAGTSFSTVCDFICAVGVDNQDSEENMVIFPNPVNDGLVHIEGAQEYKEYRIYDALGREVQSGDLSNQIDVSELEKGIYIIVVSNLEISISERLIIE